MYSTPAPPVPGVPFPTNVYVVYIMCIHSFEIKEEGPVSGMLDRRDEDMLLDLLENDKFFCIMHCVGKDNKNRFLF